MPHINAVYRIDPINGTNAAMSALTSVSFAWNSSTSKMRGTYTGHGLTTGQIVSISGSSTLNDTWKVTVIDANNFDLDYSPNTSSQTGNVTPYRGATWSNPYKSVTGIPTRHLSDTLYFPMTEEVSTGVSATFTQWSTTVTTASPLGLTLNPSNTASDWTAATNVTISTSTHRKTASTCSSIATNASFTSGKIVHRSFSSTQNLSSYAYLSFWIRLVSGSNIPANTLRISLCSDSTGNTPVKSYDVPMAIGSNWVAVVFEDTTGFGSSINSIAIYANSSFSSRTISIQNVFVSNDIHLRSAIGPQGKTHFAIANVDGTTITLLASSNIGTSLKYPYPSSTETLYYINPIFVQRNASSDTFVLENNTTFSAIPTTISPIAPEASTGPLRYIGGIDTTTDTVEGVTYFYASQHNGSSQGLGGISQTCVVENFIFAGFNVVVSSNAQADAYVEYNNIVILPNAFGTTLTTLVMGHSGAFTSIKDLVHFDINAFLPTLGSAYASYMRIERAKVYVRGDSVAEGKYRFKNCTFYINDGASNYPKTNLNPDLTLDTIEYVFENYTSPPGTSHNGFPMAFNVTNAPSGTGEVFARFHGKQLIWQTTDKPSGATGAYQFSFESSFLTRMTDKKNSLRPAVAQIATDTSTRTVSAWVKKTHATAIVCGIEIDTFDSTATVSAASVEAANNTSWQQITLTFTPSTPGLVVVRFYAYQRDYSVSGTNSALLGPVTIS